MQSNTTLRGRTFGSGLGAFVIVAFFALIVGVVYTMTHGSSAAASTKFGGFPAFLPKSTVESGALHNVVDATVAKPDLATQGDTVRVHTATGSVLITGTGPEVPNEGLPYQRGDSPTQWTVTMTNVTGTIPLSVADFDSIDDDGKTYYPSLVSGQPALPGELHAGQSITFKVHTIMKTGEGLFRWLPDGKHSPVEWDFVVEDD